MAPKTVQLVFRIDEDLAVLVNEVTVLATKASSIDDAPKAAVLRTALRRGLEAMKAELGGKAKRK